jgi:hypothetical protein
MHPRLTSCLLTLFATSVLLLSGCSGGEQLIPLSGTVVLPDGVVLGPDDFVQVVFIPTDLLIKSGAGRAKSSDKTFEVMTGPTKGLAPGSYKVMVQIELYAGADPNLASYVYGFNTRFAPNTTKLNYTMAQEPGQSITIDLQNGTITPGK